LTDAPREGSAAIAMRRGYLVGQIEDEEEA
jgi:hypothetical protein